MLDQDSCRMNERRRKDDVDMKVVDRLDDERSRSSTRESVDEHSTRDERI